MPTRPRDAHAVANLGVVLDQGIDADRNALSPMIVHWRIGAVCPTWQLLPVAKSLPDRSCPDGSGRAHRRHAPSKAGFTRLTSEL